MVVQLVLAVIPLVNLYGFYRIKRLQLAIALNIVINLASWGLVFAGMAVMDEPIGLPFPYNYLVLSPIYVFVMYRWTKVYNATLDFRI
jgi:uncharacterized membrane protein